MAIFCSLAIRVSINRVFVSSMELRIFPGVSRLAAIDTKSLVSSSQTSPICIKSVARSFSLSADCLYNAERLEAV